MRALRDVNVLIAFHRSIPLGAVESAGEVHLVSI
jgi:hypothetical protein